MLPDDDVADVDEGLPDWVEELAGMLGAFLSLFLSPSAKAEPLASATMEVMRNIGASLRMLKPPVLVGW
jgi:hypothetical protein